MTATRLLSLFRTFSKDPWFARVLLLVFALLGFLAWNVQRTIASPEEQIWTECGRGESQVELGKLNVDEDCYEAKMRAVTKKQGVPEALSILVKVGERLLSGDCHLGAHFVGREALAEAGSPAEAFLLYKDETACSAGYTHGVIEQYLKDQPPERTVKDIALEVCNAPTGTPAASPGGQWQCTHGFGHVTMANTNYDIPSSIDICDQFPDENRRYGCGYGVFMENILAGHFRRDVTSPWVKPEDPLYPCNDPAVPERYQLPCMEWAPVLIARYQTTDAKEGLAICTSQDNDAKRTGCVMGMGREIGTKQNATPEQISEWCTTIDEKYRVLCLQKSLENYMTSPDRIERGLAVCQTIPDEFLDACAWSFGGRIGWMVKDAGERAKLCDQIPEQGRMRCYQTAGLPPPRQ